jgi:nucleotide-binding universal stress UspA family protein
MTTLELGKRIKLTNIMFATDFSSCSDAALPYALAMALQYEAKIYGAHVVSSDDYLFTAPDLWPAQMKQEEKLQKETVGYLEEQLSGTTHGILFGIGDIWKVLSRFVEEHAIDLLVIGTHGRTGTRKVLMGSVAETIFRQASCPVLAVGPKVPHKGAGQIRFQHVLFATNFGDESLAALSYALSFAEEHQAELTLLHVVEQPTAGIIDLQEVKSSVQERLKNLVPQEAESWCKVNWVIEFSDQFGRASERILEVGSDRAADLIVLGVRPTHSAMGTVTHLANTTAQNVVAHALCPVLTVRGVNASMAQ